MTDPPAASPHAVSAPDSESRASVLRIADVRRLAYLAVFGFTSFFLTLAALPSWAVAGGASDSAAGVVTAVMLACTVAVQTAVPALERRLGVPRLLALGLVALAVPAPFYLLSHTLWWLVLMSAVRGAGFAVLTVIGALLTARLAPPGRHGEVVGVYGLGIAVPNLAAVPIGTALTLSDHFAWVAVAAAAPLLALPFVRGFGTVEPDRHGPPTRSGDAVRAAAPAGVMLLVVTLSGGGLLTFLPIARPDGVLAPVALLVFGATGAISRWQAGTLARRVERRLLLAFGLAAAVLGLVAVAGGLPLGGAGSATLLLAGCAALGVGYGLTQNLTQVVAFERAGPGSLATASAVWNAAFDAGTAIGAYLVGAVAAGITLPWTYVACAVLVAVTLPLVAGAREQRRVADGARVP